MERLLPSLLLLFAAQAMAAEPYTCRNGSFPALDGIEAGEVIAPRAKAVFFREDDAGCPEASSCVTPRSVRNGSRVLVAGGTGKWVCAWYFVDGKDTRWRNWNEFVGYIPASAVKLLRAPAPNLPDWTGTWTSAAATLHITRSGGDQLHVSGSAIWVGTMLPSGERDAHEGAVEGTGTPQDRTLLIRDLEDEGGCSVRLRLVGGYLVANDNHQCGGVNVNFDDVYRKQH